MNKLSDFNFDPEEERKIRFICKLFKAQSVTVSDGDWESNCKEITENNKSKLLKKTFDKA
ncbi:MAG: hypothetical protein BWY74_02825 [Firmicutes bacterium ADurb.Bin419]|nr:MAG: hypothetical protein BWY74_02825 [Firmicutes bacterium ADurb.Bin419]